MPLIKPVLEAQIFSALQELFNNTSDPPIVAQKKIATKLANAIDAYIKSATIIIPPGQVVQGINAPGQVIVGASPSGPVAGSTTSPGTVAGATSAPSPPAQIA
jgi:hypothetical protein